MNTGKGTLWWTYGCPVALLCALCLCGVGANANGTQALFSQFTDEQSDCYIIYNSYIVL